MTKPLPDKQKLRLNILTSSTLGHSTAQRTGASDTRKTVHLHLNYGLLAENPY
jgi:hypothetical protein